jgi:hypothetical protein
MTIRLEVAQEWFAGGRAEAMNSCSVPWANADRKSHPLIRYRGLLRKECISRSTSASFDK